MNKVLFSKKSDDWSTPSYIYNYFMNYNYYDPCPLNCKYDSLIQDWKYQRIFINPPFSKTKEFVIKSIETHIKYKNQIVLLIPCRCDTSYFQTLLKYGVDIHFFKGRLHFNNSKLGAPFPCCLITLTGLGYSTIDNIIYDFKKNIQIVLDI